MVGSSCKQFIKSSKFYKYHIRIALHCLHRTSHKLSAMANYVPIIILSLIVIVTIQQGSSIKCWVCRSDTDPKCADPFDNTTVPITDCKKERPLEHLPGALPTMCRKIRQKVNGEWRYFRSCAYMGEPGLGGDERFCLMRTGTYNIFMEYCTCNSKDGCNGAPSSVSFSPILLISTGVVSLFTLLRLTL